jgi:hypothetical protein
LAFPSLVRYRSSLFCSGAVWSNLRCGNHTDPLPNACHPIHQFPPCHKIQNSVALDPAAPSSSQPKPNKSKLRRESRPHARFREPCPDTVALQSLLTSMEGLNRKARLRSAGPNGGGPKRPAWSGILLNLPEIGIDLRCLVRCTRPRELP